LRVATLAVCAAVCSSFARRLVARRSFARRSLSSRVESTDGSRLAPPQSVQRTTVISWFVCCGCGPRRYLYGCLVGVLPTNLPTVLLGEWNKLSWFLPQRWLNYARGEYGAPAAASTAGTPEVTVRLVPCARCCHCCSRAVSRSYWAATGVDAAVLRHSLTRQAGTSC